MNDLIDRESESGITGDPDPVLLSEASDPEQDAVAVESSKQEAAPKPPPPWGSAFWPELGKAVPRHLGIRGGGGLTFRLKEACPFHNILPCLIAKKVSPMARTYNLLDIGS